MTPVVEAKVAWPAVVTACASVLTAALYKLALAYGFHPTTAQNAAILGVGLALQYVLFVVTGYYAPHTPRPDLTPDPMADPPAGLAYLGPPGTMADPVDSAPVA